jgi:hypothetical protein
MKFEYARCYTCERTIKDIGDLVAYRLVVRDVYPFILEPVDLHGQEPWSGIRVVCTQCLKFFREVSTSGVGWRI